MEPTQSISTTAPPPDRDRRIHPLRQVADTEPTARVSGYAYVVDLGQTRQPRLHTVHKDRTCTCGNSSCVAVAIVADWLKSGRLERAPDPPLGYTPFRPNACPVCGASVFVDHGLSSRQRGLGWQCSLGGVRHYWQHRWELIKGWFFRDEILPGVNRADIQASATRPLGYLPSANCCAVEPTHQVQPEATLLSRSEITRGAL